MSCTEDPRAVLASEFARQVAADPEAVALRHDGKDFTRHDLDAWSEAIAVLLQDAGAGPGSLVGLTVDRGAEAIASVLGIVKAGAGYLALDPDLPLRRQRALIDLAAPGALILQDHLDRLPTVDLPRIWADQGRSGPGTRRAQIPATADGSRVFHVVSTSGTTGTPRAVRISYGAVLNRLRWMWADHPFGEDATVLMYKSYGLVASPWEMLGGLLRGVRSVSVRRDQLLHPELLTDIILQERISHLYLTPQLLAGLLAELDRRGADAPQLAFVTSGADALPVGLARRFRLRLPHAKLFNLYGATETASNIAAFDTARLAEDARVVPVGRPVAGAVLTVRDRRLRPVPVGVQGEVCVSGPPLALGYVGDPTGEAERFVPLPDGSVLHRTGDVGVWNDDGNLEIIGRLDNQVKVRGYRVVLEAVEAVLAAAPYVTGAGVRADTDVDNTVLTAFLTGTNDLDLPALEAFVRDRLPGYMCPDRFHPVMALPFNAHGKLDRPRLAELQPDDAPYPADAEVTPRGPVEEAVAKIWTSLLGRGPRLADEDFFDAGGHSMLAVQLVTRLEEAIGVALPLRCVLEDPAFNKIAARAEQLTAL